MAKKDAKIVLPDGCETSDLQAVKGCRPCGSQVLLELLTVQEMMGTELFVKNTKTHTEYQAIILSLGPNLDPEVYGFKVGDRVLLSGTGVPVPNYDNSEREKILMEPYCVKGVLV